MSAWFSYAVVVQVHHYHKWGDSCIHSVCFPACIQVHMITTNGEIYLF
jgi:hypothetical protein